MQSAILYLANRFYRILVISSVAVISISFSACGTPGSSLGPALTSTAVALTAATTPRILLFNGVGTSASDVSAVEAILASKSLHYSTVNSSQLNAMPESTLKTYKLLIVPGGNSITIGNNLKRTTTANIHNAVINEGLHYLGICAGGFFGGYSIYNGLNLTSGAWFNFYSDYHKGINIEAVQISRPNASRLDQYWQDGPEFAGWGKVVGKYPNGTPAVVEGTSGKGWVILSGVHPEAPASWRAGMTFTTPVAVDNNYAATLIFAALNGTTLAHY